jgi:hypothetical protein
MMAADGGDCEEVLTEFAAEESTSTLWLSACKTKEQSRSLSHGKV